MGSKQKDSQSQSSVASLTQSSSLPSTQKLDSLPIMLSSYRTRSESPTILYQPSFGQIQILTHQLHLGIQPVVSTSVSNLQADPLVQSNYTNEQSASLKSADLVNSREASSQVSIVGLNTILGQPLSASSIPPSGVDSAINVKSGYSDVVTHEDEMEEKAPENSQLIVNALGNLAGFGIGTAAAPVSTKPNPFGVVSLNKASSPASSLFTSTASGGELFRQHHLLQPHFHESGSSSEWVWPAGSGWIRAARFRFSSWYFWTIKAAWCWDTWNWCGIYKLFWERFMSNSSAGGFGGGFSGVSSTAGGFSSLGSGGVGFGASAARSAAATSAGGFGASATAGGGFAAPTVVGSGFSDSGSFGPFSSQQSGGSGFPAFSGSSATARPPSELFTQMRKLLYSGSVHSFVMKLVKL
ncbi:hypothetical protein H5410_002977, partial [Solanum commersonii]